MSEEIAYAVTKGAVETLTRTISQCLAQRGITINAVNPGPTDTGWMDEQLTAVILGKSPMGRVGTPRDVARLIGFLASEEAEWVTGQIIHSEGGFTR
jgi:3-oxoacyl-[acyl-carrier protein] reductase